MIKNYDDFLNESAVIPFTAHELFNDVKLFIADVFEKEDEREDDVEIQCGKFTINVIFRDAENDEEARKKSFRKYGFVTAGHFYASQNVYNSIKIEINKENFDEAYRNESTRDELIVFYAAALGHEMIHARQTSRGTERSGQKYIDAMDRVLDNTEKMARNLLLALNMKGTMNKRMQSKHALIIGIKAYLSDDNEISAWAWDIIVKLFYYIGSEELRKILIKTDSEIKIHIKKYEDNIKETVNLFRGILKILEPEKRKKFRRFCYEYYNMLSPYDITKTNESAQLSDNEYFSFPELKVSKNLEQGGDLLLRRGDLLADSLHNYKSATIADGDDYQYKVISGNNPEMEINLSPRQLRENTEKLTPAEVESWIDKRLTKLKFTAADISRIRELYPALYEKHRAVFISSKIHL